MLVEIVEELRPRHDVVSLEVAQRKRESVIDRRDERDDRDRLSDQPLGDLLAAPVPERLLGRRRRENASRILGVEGGVDLQCRRAGSRCCPTRVVDADVKIESDCVL